MATMMMELRGSMVMEALKCADGTSLQMGGQLGQGLDAAPPQFSQPTLFWPTMTRPGIAPRAPSSPGPADRAKASLFSRPEFLGAGDRAGDAGPPLPWKLLGFGPPPGLELGRDLSPAVKQTPDDASTSGGSANYVSEGGDESSETSTTMSPTNFNAADSPDYGPSNTLMIKHLPCRCSEEEVLNAIAEVGYGDSHNFFYLPIRRGHTQNFGYAFVGFATKELSAGFEAAMTGYRFAGRTSTKACAIAPARIQGITSNMGNGQQTRGRRKSRLGLSTGA
jgi:hypothetical protein